MEAMLSHLSQSDDSRERSTSRRRRRNVWFGDCMFGCKLSARICSKTHLKVSLQLIAPPQTPSLIPTIVIDPSSDECKGKNMQAFITMACMPAMDTVTDLNVQGSVQPPVLKEVRSCFERQTSLPVSDS